MIEVLVYIKHHLIFIWDFIEWINSILFYMFFGKRLKSVSDVVLEKFSGLECKELQIPDLIELEDFFRKQPESAYKFFNPHGFDLKSLHKKKRDKSFLMIGFYKNNHLAGYCFIRFFFNKKAFRGKIVGVDYQGQGIAKQMGILTTCICQKMGFRLFATISKENVKSIASSRAVNDIRIVKELPDNYIYVEYLIKNDDNKISL